MSQNEVKPQKETQVTWERISNNSAYDMHRAKVPGGWLVRILPNVQYIPSVCFYPDPNHSWLAETDIYSEQDKEATTNEESSESGRSVLDIQLDIIKGALSELDVDVFQHDFEYIINGTRQIAENASVFLLLHGPTFTDGHQGKLISSLALLGYKRVAIDDSILIAPIGTEIKSIN